MRPPCVPEFLGHLVSAVPLGRDQLTTRAEADRSHTALEAENVRGDVDKSVLNPLCSQLRCSFFSVGLSFLRRLQMGVKGSSRVSLLRTTWNLWCKAPTCHGCGQLGPEPINGPWGMGDGPDDCPE